jgi:hypothetical protein
MNRFGQRLLIWSVLLSFAVFFGVELATRGIGDLEGNGAASGMASGERVIQAEDLLKEMQQTAQQERVMREQPTAAAIEPVRPEPHLTQNETVAAQHSDNLVEGLANKTGHLLRVTAQGSVEFIIGLLDGMLN